MENTMTTNTQTMRGTIYTIDNTLGYLRIMHDRSNKISGARFQVIQNMPDTIELRMPVEIQIQSGFVASVQFIDTRNVQAIIAEFAADGCGYICPTPTENLSNTMISFHSPAFVDQTLIKLISSNDLIGLNGLPVTVMVEMGECGVKKVFAVTLNDAISASSVTQRANEMRRQEYLNRFTPQSLFGMAKRVCDAAMNEGLRPAAKLALKYFKFEK
jgi:hypothetical protein